MLQKVSHIDLAFPSFMWDGVSVFPTEIAKTGGLCGILLFPGLRPLVSRAPRRLPADWKIGVMLPHSKSPECRSGLFCSLFFVLFLISFFRCLPGILARSGRDHFKTLSAFLLPLPRRPHTWPESHSLPARNPPGLPGHRPLPRRSPGSPPHSPLSRRPPRRDCSSRS